MDLVGILLLWKYGIPNKRLPPKDKQVTEWVDEVPEENRARFNRARLVRIVADNLSYFLLFLGFAAQLASNYVPTI